MKKYYLSIGILFIIISKSIYSNECNCYFVEGYYAAASDTISNFYVYRNGHHTTLLNNEKIDSITQVTIQDTISLEIFSYLQRTKNVKKMRICNWRQIDYSRIYALLALYSKMESFEVCDKNFGNKQLTLLQKLPLEYISIETEQPILFSNRWENSHKLSVLFIYTASSLQFEKGFCKKASINNVVLHYDASKGFPIGVNYFRDLKEIAFIDMVNFDAESALRKLSPISDQIKILYFNNCDIVAIPKALGQFSNIEAIGIVGSKLSNDIDVLSKLKKLKGLYLVDVKYTLEEKWDIKNKLTAIKDIYFDE